MPDFDPRFHSYPFIAQNEHLIPDFCELRKPKSDGNCETERRWFLHETKGCKPFGICRHQTAELDAQTGINYFTSKESCQSACAEGEHYNATYFAHMQTNNNNNNNNYGAIIHMQAGPDSLYRRPALIRCIDC